jgi:hypothetical protein
MIDLNKVTREGVNARINENAEVHSGSLEYWLANYYEPERGKDEAADARAVFEAEPALLTDLAQRYKTQHHVAMVEEVAKDPKEVYKNTSPAYLAEMVERHIGDDNYRALADAIENDNGIPEAFLALHGGSTLLGDLVAMASEDAVKKGAENARARIRTKELTESGIANADGSMNRESAATYVAVKVMALPDEQKFAYLAAAGISYASTQAPEHFQGRSD